MKKFKVLYLASEVAPFSKAGGLADVIGALPKSLKGLNQEIRMMIPKYKFINERKYVLREVIRLREIPVELNGQQKVASVKSAFLPDSKVQIYFIEIEDYFNRPGIYTDPKTNKPYEDNAERFAFFAKAALETLKKLSWQPEIIHCNDWQTAFVPVYLKTEYMNDPFFKGVKTVYTIHNLTSQGEFETDMAKKIDFDESQTQEGGMFNKEGKLNLTKGAIYFSDFISTVSENYAHEILEDSTLGFGFSKLLQDKEDKFEGILNGVDYSVWSPDNDKLIPYRYDKEKMDGKTENKKTLLNRLGLTYDEKIPLFGMVSKISKHKGIDIILDSIDALMKMKIQLIIYGDGDRDLVKALMKKGEQYKDKMVVNVTYDDKIEHLILAGSDFYLMPSKYEPCGLNQIYSLRYATIPLVSAAGGLFDTVEDIDMDEGDGTGFLVEPLDKANMVEAVQRAVKLYENKELFNKIRQEIMDEDFSWDISAKRYVDVYDRLVNEE
ncbi:MAG: glycosyltransferase [Caldithrix sp.]|nr:glycosyltransferase [Caldithrix sp.]